MSLGLSFDVHAEEYDRFRPGYAKELYEEICRYGGIGSKSRAVEIGPGSGQATAPMLSLGCHITAVEPGERFCTLLKDRFSAWPEFRIINGKFEDVALAPGNFDCVYSATAFHWVPEEVGYQKVFAILKPGGIFARFQNRPYRCPDDPLLAEEIDALYGRYYYPFYGKPAQKYLPYTEAEANDLAKIAEKYGFCHIQCHLFYRDRVFTSKEYIRLLSTYSDHLALGDDTRTAFFEELEKAIDSHGGTIQLRDTMDLQLARKPYQ